MTTDVPVAILNQPTNIGTVLLNAYLKHFLGPRTAGRVLNVGAGTASVMYRQREMFGATEYHTLESAESGIAATYVCSATRMSPIADEHYDWIFSTSVLEHVDDPWAAAREQIRVCKPDGFVYVHTPFAQPMHPHPTFGDFWRFTPQGLGKLFQGCYAREIEIWGDNPVRPNSFAVLFQKPGPLANPPGSMRVRWFEYPNEDPFYLLTVTAATQIDWPVYELTIEPMNLAMQINDAWNKISAQYELALPHHVMIRKFKPQFAQRIGTLRVRGDRSAFDTSV